MKRGFTLIEIVGVLVLLGITGVFAGMMLSSTVQRFTQEKEAAAMNQKTEAAMARLVKELTWANPTSLSITNAGRTISWQSRHPERIGDGTQTLSWNGTPGSDLLLQGQPLLDRVDFFEIPDTVSGGSVTIKLRNTVQSTLHSTLIYLRDDI